MDFVGNLLSVAEGERAQLVREALALPDGYVEVPEASAAVAAAALVAASNGMPVHASAEVGQLIRSGTIPADEQVRTQAGAALSRVNGDECEWRELWDDAELLTEAADILNRIRLHL
jgi:hypothetical protein